MVETIHALTVRARAPTLEPPHAPLARLVAQMLEHMSVADPQRYHVIAKAHGLPPYHRGGSGIEASEFLAAGTPAAPAESRRS
jgi:hypothetical protein